MRRTASLIVAVCASLGSTASAQVNLGVYGDVDYVYDSSQEPTQSFEAPRLEFFPTATQDRLFFLAEALFEVGDDNEFGVDVERIEVAYLFSDYFRLRVGRFHTAIGYYNDAYHHGHYFQIAVDRPEMVRFEDEGGLIPAHSVGIHADGRLPLGPVGSLRYDVEVANGRGHTPEEVTNLFDANNQKAVNLRLRLEPGFPDGLILGGNIYYDVINATLPAMPLATERIEELILGVHTAYLENYVHFIAEYLQIVHRTGNIQGVTHAAYGELAYTFNIVTPYVRGQRVLFPPDLDAFYAQNILAQRGSFISGVAGLRFTVSDFLAVKVEVGITRLDDANKADIRAGAVQCAFAF
jgi:hypothetical protein